MQVKESVQKKPEKIDRRAFLIQMGLVILTPLLAEPQELLSQRHSESTLQSLSTGLEELPELSRYPNLLSLFDGGSFQDVVSRYPTVHLIGSGYSPSGSTIDRTYCMPAAVMVHQAVRSRSMDHFPQDVINEVGMNSSWMVREAAEAGRSLSLADISYTVRSLSSDRLPQTPYIVVIRPSSPDRVGHWFTVFSLTESESIVAQSTLLTAITGTDVGGGGFYMSVLDNVSLGSYIQNRARFYANQGGVFVYALSS